MKKIRSRLIFQILFAFVALALTLLEPGSVSAQKRRPLPGTVKPPDPDPTTNSSVNRRSAEQAAMEMGLLMSRRNVVTDLERQRQRGFAQLADNLEQLERINSTKIAPLLAKIPLDYKSLALSSAELKARANKIKFYSPIALVDRTGEKIRYDSDATQLPALLSQLSASVTRFVDSPVFRISAPNDQELRSAAAHELERIIKLSDAINRIARRLSKPLVASR